MKRLLRLGALVVSTALAMVALVMSCSGSTDSQTGDKTVIDEAAVERAIDEMSAIIPICTNSSAAVASRVTAPPSRLSRYFAFRYDPAFRAAYTQPEAGLGSTKPADVLGDCGGRITYPSYSHSNGVTTGTYAFENYCTVDDDTGERQTLNGSISFVNTGTPSQSGPYTNKIEATSPGGVSAVFRSSAGALLSSQRYTFEDYVYTAGVPGGTPTASSPDRVSIVEFEMINEVTNKRYRGTDYQSAWYETTSGGSSQTLSGRSYRSNGEWFDVNTTQPFVTTANGDIAGGQITFTGANNSRAVLTFVPGSELQATMTVNGTPVTSVPACR